MRNDVELLRCYLESESHEAFAELVRRHIDMVYSVALRTVNGDVHLARDVTQGAFIKLATEGAAAARAPVLAGWLYTVAHNTACKAIRSEVRRRRWEKEAMNDSTAAAVPSANWEKIRPILDDAVHDLSAEDRDAIVLRFFERRSFAEIGGHLDITENAARMRAERALDKLRVHLERRGIQSTGAALAIVLAEQALTTASVELTAIVIQSSLIAAMAAATAFTSLSLLNIMSTLKNIAVAGLITVSLVANALLLTGMTEKGASLLHGAVTNIADIFGHHPKAEGTASGKTSASRQSGPATSLAPAPAGATFSRLYSDDPATFADNLLAAGFTRAQARGAVAALLRTLKNRQEIQMFTSDPPPPFWRTTHRAPLSPAQIEGFVRIDIENAKTLRALFPEEKEAFVLTASGRFGPLSPDKLEKLDTIEREYRGKRLEVSPENPIAMGWSIGQLAQLEQAKQREIQELLTPAEYEEYNFRTSPIAAAVRQMPMFDPTQDEFRAVYQARSSYETQTRAALGNGTPQASREAQQQMNDQIRTALGDDRYAVYQRASDRGFQDAYAITQQLSLPTDNAVAVYQLQRDAQTRANTVRRNPELGADEQASQLRELAASTNTQLATLLTPGGVQTYKRGGGTWLAALEKSTARHN